MMPPGDGHLKEKVRLLRLVGDCKYVPHVPTTKQSVFLGLDCKEAMYGGAAGGGKSDALLMAALQFIHVPKYTALLLRRSYQDLAKPEALMDRAHTWLDPHDEVHWDSTTKTFTFPSGARLEFGYLGTKKDLDQYQSAEYQSVGYDELTQFEETEYRYLFSRLRRPELPCRYCDLPLEVEGGYVHDPRADFEHRNMDDPRVQRIACDLPEPDETVLEEYPPSDKDGRSIFEVPLRMRSATNPGNRGHRWVKQRFIEQGKAESRPFVPAKLEDNPYVNRDEYASNLQELDPVTRERLLSGDWEVRAGGGYFDRSWFNFARRPPADARVVRYWDMASTEPSPENPDPDYLVGLKMGLYRGEFYVIDVVRDRLRPADVEHLIETTAEMDGYGTEIVIEREPGSEGKSYINRLMRDLLSGYAVYEDPVGVDKETRAKPVSADVENGLVTVCSTEGWSVTAFFDELEGFPSVAHDDQVDALSGAHRWLTREGEEEEYAAAKE